MFQTFVFSRTTIYFLLYPRHLFRFIVLCNNAATIGSTASKVQLQRTAAMPNARASHARQAVFVFLPSPLHFTAVSHWKQTPYVWRLHHSPKTTYLTMVQWLKCEGSYLHLDAPFEQWVTRQKRRSKLPRDTTARRVKAASRKAHPLAFTRNTLCTKFLQRILTRIHEVTSSRINHLLSIDWKRKSTRWRQKNENSLSARNARARRRPSGCGGADGGCLKTDSFSPKARNFGEKVHQFLLPLRTFKV